MYKTTLGLCANKILQDVTTNMMSAVDIIEEFNAPGLPFVIPNLNVLWTLERAEEDSPTPSGRIKIAQNGQPIGDFPLDINFQGQLRNRSILLIGGIVIGQLSNLEVEFWLNEELDTSLSFPVKVQARVEQNP